MGIFEKFTRSTEIIYLLIKITLRVNILRLKIGIIDTITKITNLVSVLKEKKYYFELERILL